MKIIQKCSRLFIVAILLSGCSVENVSNRKEFEEPVGSLEAVVETKNEETTITISAIGDILIHDRVYNNFYTTDDNFDFSPAFINVKDTLIEKEFVIANAETLIGGIDLGLSGYPQFNSPIEIGMTLKDIGVDLVTVANNHVFDKGEKGLKASLQNWDELDMPFIGAYRNEDEKNSIQVIKIKDLNVAFLSYTFGTNGLTLQEQTIMGTKFLDEDLARSEIQQAKELADVVVVSAHFGKEYESIPNNDQKSWAQFFADEGVNVVIGSHPHVLQPPSFLKGKNGNETYVMYSIGNFFSGQRGVERQIGGIFSITISKNEVGEIKLSNPDIELTYVSSENDEDYLIHSLKETPLDDLPNRDLIYEELSKQLQLFTPIHIK